MNTDGIHPNHAGYKQMGDALAGVIEAVRNWGIIIRIMTSPEPSVGSDICDFSDSLRRGLNNSEKRHSRKSRLCLF